MADLCNSNFNLATTMEDLICKFWFDQVYKILV